MKINTRHYFQPLIINTKQQAQELLSQKFKRKWGLKPNFVLESRLFEQVFDRGKLPDNVNIHLQGAIEKSMQLSGGKKTTLYAPVFEKGLDLEGSMAVVTKQIMDFLKIKGNASVDVEHIKGKVDVKPSGALYVYQHDDYVYHSDKSIAKIEKEHGLLFKLGDAFYSLKDLASKVF